MSSYEFPVDLQINHHRVAKSKAVQKLYDYWTNKTTLLRMRQDPGLTDEREVQRQAVEYLSEHSDLSDQPFWKKLNENGREQAAQLFSIQEVTGKRKVRLTNNKMRASIYIVLSGSASVAKGGGSESVVYKPGQMFGATDMFNQVVQNVGSYDELGEAPDDVVELENGTFMRLTLGDLYDRVLNPPVEEEEDTRAIDEEIAEIAYEDMTEDDKFYVRVYKRVKELVNKNFFAFIDAYRMVPKNANMPAYKYYQEGSLGREMYLDEHDPVFVFVLIDGAMRIDITPTRESRGSHTISCKRKGRKPMFIKTTTLPLMSLSSGSIMCIDPSTLRIGRPVSAPNLSLHHDDDLSTVGILDAGSSVSMGSLASMSMRSPVIPTGLASSPTGSIAQHGHGAASSASSSRSSTGRGILSRINRPNRHQLPPKPSVRTRNLIANREAAVITTGQGGGGGSSSSERRFSESSVSSQELATLSSSFAFNSMTSTMEAKLNQSNQKRSNQFVPHSKPPNNPDAEYHVKIVFEKMTTYLAIPYSNFDKLLKDDKLVLPKIAKEIFWNLDHSNNTIYQRIQRLLPWVKGDLSFRPMDTSVLEGDKPAFLLTDLVDTDGDPRDPDYSLTLPKGSFLPRQKTEDDWIPLPMTSSKAPVKEPPKDLVMQTMLRRLRSSQASADSNDSGRGVDLEPSASSKSMFLTQQSLEKTFEMLGLDVEEGDGATAAAAAAAVNNETTGPVLGELLEITDELASHSEEHSPSLDRHSISVSVASAHSSAVGNADQASARGGHHASHNSVASMKSARSTKSVRSGKSSRSGKSGKISKGSDASSSSGGGVGSQIKRPVVDINRRNVRISSSSVSSGDESVGGGSTSSRSINKAIDERLRKAVATNSKRRGSSPVSKKTHSSIKVDLQSPAKTRSTSSAATATASAGATAHFE